MVVGGRVITYGELLLWIGLWFMMATIQGFHNYGFWGNITIYPAETAPYRFNDILPQTCFKDILKALTITE